MNDDELLSQYVAQRSEPAFAELVRRHLGLVYTTALRRVGGDAHLAEDVAQEVFTALARKASALRDRPALTGWLYLSTHHAAAAVVRRERRRRQRETEAEAMKRLNSSENGADWQRVRSVLDDAIIELREEEREIVALRFFEKRSLAEIGAAFRVTEEAARKRVDRALEKLHRLLSRRGITSTAAGLGTVLEGTASGSVPAGLAARIAAQAMLPAATTVVSLTGLATGLGVAAGLAIGGWAIFHQHEANHRLELELSRVNAEQRTIGRLRSENEQLARSARDADDLRRAAAELPAVQAAVATAQMESLAPPRPRATVTVESDGTIHWKWGPGAAGAEAVTLNEFMARLKRLQQTGEADLNVRGFASFPALAYVIDEARKAQVRHLVVESAATIDPQVGHGLWFGRR